MSFVLLPESPIACRNLVGGEWLVPTNPTLLDVRSPYTGGVIGRVPQPFSFGGIGESRFGHGDITGTPGVEFWSLLKKVTRKWSARTDGSWMS